MNRKFLEQAQDLLFDNSKLIPENDYIFNMDLMKKNYENLDAMTNGPNKVRGPHDPRWLDALHIAETANRYFVLFAQQMLGCIKLNKTYGGTGHVIVKNLWWGQHDEDPDRYALSFDPWRTDIPNIHYLGTEESFSIIPRAGDLKFGVERDGVWYGAEGDVVLTFLKK